MRRKGDEVTNTCINAFGVNSHLIKGVRSAYVMPTLHILAGDCTYITPIGWKTDMLIKGNGGQL